MSRKQTRGRHNLYSIEQLDRVRAMMLALPISKKGITVPYGYVEDPEDKTQLIPDDETFRLLHDARYKYWGECPIKEIAIWLTKKTGIYISDEGITQIMMNRPPDKAVVLPLGERFNVWRQTTLKGLPAIEMQVVVKEKPKRKRKPRVRKLPESELIL